MYHSFSDVKERHIFCVFLLLPLISEFLAIVAMDMSRLLTIAINVLFVIYAFYIESRRNNIKEFLLLLGIYAFFYLNYVFFPSGREYYLDTSMLLIYCVYLPIAIFCITRIQAWDKIFDTLMPYCIVASLIAIFVVFFADASIYSELFSYMEFSYNVIPFAACSWIIFRQNKRRLYLILFLIITICVLLYGSRAALFFELLFVLSFEIKQVKNKGIIIPLLIIIVYIVANVAHIFINSSIVQNNESLSDSYILARFIDGNLFESEGRSEIYQRSFQRLTNMGLEIDGLFGDRLYNGIWPHNIFLELLMQFGWFIGSFFCAFIIILIIRSLFTNKYIYASLFIIICLLGRYWFSGSYVIEGKFWIGMFSLISIIRSYKQTFI